MFMSKLLLMVMPLYFLHVLQSPIHPGCTGYQEYRQAVGNATFPVVTRQASYVEITSLWQSTTAD